MSNPESQTLARPKPVFENFTDASKAVLHFMNERIGMELWMITRVQDDNWIILDSNDHGYGVHNGQVLHWPDSFCSRMVKGEGPRIAPDVSQVPAYANAPIGRQVRIGSYVGIPLTKDDGSLFGTLCAISPTPRPKEIEREQPLAELLSALLSTVLSEELRAVEARRQAEVSRADSQRDALTGLFNRRGWDELLAREQDRQTRYGHHACVLSIDLNGLKSVNDTMGHPAGDGLIRDAAHMLRDLARRSDIVARMGGDEFNILAIECDSEKGASLVHRIRQKMAQTGISGAIGLAEAIGTTTLQQACQSADSEMYKDKRAMKADRLALPAAS